MALARCRKCGKIASTAAKHCPHCGVRNPTKKPTSPFVTISAAFAGTALLLGAVQSSALRDGLSQSIIVDLPHMPIAASAPVVPNRAIQREKQRFEATVAVASVIKQSLENPQSLVWETILSDDDATVICLEYRVKDNQGDYSKAYITYMDGKASEAPEDWNRYCAGKKLNDMIRAKDAI